jgi:hypothetical protein
MRKEEKLICDYWVLYKYSLRRESGAEGKADVLQKKTEFLFGGLSLY